MEAGEGAGLVVDELARLPERAMLDEAALARMFGVTKRTVRRMVRRGELPPAVRFAGRSTWLAGRVIAHVEAQADRAAEEAEAEAKRIRRFAG